MQLKNVFIRFYKSFNFDYLKKYEYLSKKDLDNKFPWDNIENKFYPYIRIPIDENITTIVGANESGKSHLLSAIEKGIKGKDYKSKAIDIGDFCRHSQFYKAQKFF